MGEGREECEFYGRIGFSSSELKIIYSFKGERGGDFFFWNRVDFGFLC